MTTSSNNIPSELAQIALEKVEGFAFEGFAQDFMSVLEGRSFIPLGGVGDGGADGIYDCGNSRTYYQFTRQENHRDKIRKTYNRLKEFGRTVKTIYYLSSRTIPHIDNEEDFLSEELGVFIKIRDRKYIVSHINDSTGTMAAYNNHLSVYTQFLESIARPDNSFRSAQVKDPTAFVFLQHEVTNRLGNRKLVHSLTDTMILWALSETNPDDGIFMSEGEVQAKIFDSFPWATKLLCLSVYTQFLESIARPDNSFRSAQVKDPTAFVFLQHEVTNRLGNRKLVHSLTDTMILWALSETNPDDGIFMSEGEVQARKWENSSPCFSKMEWTTFPHNSAIR